jgi:hypothetical protein
MGDNEKAWGRLAAREAHGMVGMSAEASAGTDRERAIYRIIDELKVPILHAKVVRARLVQHLQDADLTINFAVHKFFNSKPSGTGYVSQFEGGDAWGNAGYITARDTAEEAMFDYSGARAHAGVPLEVKDRVKDRGGLAEADFEPAARPKYAALNYACLDYGSAGQWGKSHMVLKEHVKHNATYVHTDSFDESGNGRQRAALPDKIATYLDMDRLLANMPEVMLKALFDVAVNKTTFDDQTQVPGLGGTAYIEAHIHGDVRFDRDIAKIVISIDELNNAEAATRALKLAGTPFKVRDSAALEKVFRKFAQRYGITVAKV